MNGQLVHHQGEDATRHTQLPPGPEHGATDATVSGAHQSHHRWPRAAQRRPQGSDYLWGIRDDQINTQFLSQQLTQTPVVGSTSGKNNPFLYTDPPYMNKDYCDTTLSGYSYHCEVNNDGYEIIAQPETCGATGLNNFRIETGGIKSEAPCARAPTQSSQ